MALGVEWRAGIVRVQYLDLEEEDGDLLMETMKVISRVISMIPFA